MSPVTVSTNVTEQSLELLRLAQKARLQAYAPYSRLLVGVALRTRAGSVHAGCNIENTAFPEGWCAETSAISAMIMACDGVESREIVELVVIADHTPPITPCGGCRQRIKEFGGPDTIVHAADLDGIKQSFLLGDLLPAAFGL
ncbi:cytidine deaminase [Cohaesibacter sp. CAU 1516]|uniref:cytidine deaminase n=1 Tax=Cohaesibacter sp. CAU 1516 TaxID=2576038 RepID=UPI0010FE9CB1|nr:cytidine deaminase [Cohaesibacter sp. CAU 1516]TLP46015.1 cytidine deaminase [Cohaesibacter sp. CAU 1516]